MTVPGSGCARLGPGGDLEKIDEERGRVRVSRIEIVDETERHGPAGNLGSCERMLESLVRRREGGVEEEDPFREDRVPDVHVEVLARVAESGLDSEGQRLAAHDSGDVLTDVEAELAFLDCDVV